MAPGLERFILDGSARALSHPDDTEGIGSEMARGVTAARQLNLLFMLKQAGALSVEEASALLGVSRRTLYRDLEVMQRAGCRSSPRRGKTTRWRLKGRSKVLSERRATIRAARTAWPTTALPFHRRESGSLRSSTCREDKDERPASKNMPRSGEAEPWIARRHAGWLTL
jgi:hypothetical protein